MGPTCARTPSQFRVAIAVTISAAIPRYTPLTAKYQPNSALCHGHGERLHQVESEQGVQPPVREQHGHANDGEPAISLPQTDPPVGVNALDKSVRRGG